MTRILALALAAATVATGAPAMATADETPHAPVQSDDATSTPLVIGHRGASGYRPEHTLASYELAARQGADFIEPDLVPTKDGVLVARHENEISGTTDVAARPEFADRKATKIIDGSEVTGWFTEDFTLAELKTLRATERLPQLRPENTEYDGLFEVPTFEEILELRERLSAELGREIGVYPETKHPTYFTEQGLPMERTLVEQLAAYDLNRVDAPVFVQSFEVWNLIRANHLHGLRAPSVFLIWKEGAPYDFESRGSTLDFEWFTTKMGLSYLRGHGIDGVGPEMSLVISWNKDGTLGEDTGLVDRAHARGLQVHPYTFRAENTFLPKEYRSSDVPSEHGDLDGLIKRYLQTGIDGFFTDHPDVGVKARNQFVAAPSQR